MKPSISIIGAGKVGSTLARLLSQANYQIPIIYSRTFANAQSLAEKVGARAAVSAEEAVMGAELVILAVPDDVLSIVVDNMRQMDWANKAVIHTSGANGLLPLLPLGEKGAMLGTFHPAFPFAEVEAAVRGLAGAGFAIEAENELLRLWLLEIVAALKGRPILIPAGKKALYHAALVIASNYTVTLYAIGQSLLRSLGANDEAISATLNVLLDATTYNILNQGIPEALTGPLVRTDIGTIAAHLQIIEDENLRNLYKELARFTYPMLEERGINTEIIEKVLQENL